ncbi:MAG TPA: DnaJ domain-containing protein [Candidatus Limnocylindria bacterium]|jgi:curved DNA-binding protein CbpA
MTAVQRDYYKVLQVDPEASLEVITAAYRTLAKRFHPETDLTGVHEIRVAELNRAFDVLRDAAARQRYDLERADRLQPVGPGPEPILTPAVVAPPRHHTSADGTPDGDSMLSRTGASGGPPPMTSAEVASSAGELRLDFGRYEGWSLYDLAKQDPAYLRWLARHSSGLRFRREIARVLGDPLDDPYAPSR